MLIVGHRNVNKMIIKNLMGLSFEQAYQVEHKNSWLYLFFPKKGALFLIRIPTPRDLIQIQSGYEKIEAISIK